MTDASKPAAFRKDLKLFPGPREPDGSPTHNLYDPVKGRYFKLSWEEMLIYKAARAGMSYEDIAKAVRAYSTARLEPEEIQQFYGQAARLGLLRIPRSSQEVMQESIRSKGNFWWWLVMHYLYIKLPLFKPDAFLEKTLPFARLFWSRAAIILYLLITVIGLFSVLGRWDEFVHSFSYFFNFEGLIAYSLAIFGVKVIHELAHAYTAKHFDVNVPTMGVAFLVLWPVLYTDVTDSWKLPKRSQRLAISGAGIVAELTLAGLATLGWALSPPGIIQSVFFVLASTTWISSLFMNLNPVMRFDGYYILCDLWGIDNLRPRAFAVARWKVHEWLFGFNLPPPEENLSRARMWGMVAYSLFSWVYLLILYTVIALFVYHQFAKALGIFLFSLEIAIFFVWPIVWEVQEVLKLRRYFHWNIHVVMTLLVASLLATWLILPLPHSVRFVGITIPAKEQLLYVPYEGQIMEIFTQRGDQVAEGKKLVHLQQKALETELQGTKQDVDLLEETLRLFSTNKDYQPLIPAKQRELQAIRERLRSLEKKEEQMTLIASLPGTVYEWDDHLRPGQFVEKNQILGRLAELSQTNVLAFVPEQYSSYVKLGQPAVFHLHDGETIKGKVIAIQTSRASYLDHAVLASRLHGPLPVVLTPERRFRLTESYYVAKIELEKPVSFGKSGQVTVKGPARSYLWEGLRYLWSVLLQESSL